MKLDNRDLDILIDSVDCWVNKEFGSELMYDLIEATSAQLQSLHPEDIEKMRVKKVDRESKRKQDKKLREELAIMLKAKLLTIKQDNAIVAIESMK